MIRRAAACTALVGLTAYIPPATALDGCLILLCLAAPSWSAIALCVPPVEQLFDDLAHGHPFPTCAMAGGSNSASHRWAHAPDHCPPQYTHVYHAANGPVYRCDYSGAVSVDVNGELWTRVWWRRDGGGTVTEYTPAAKAQLGSWQTRFDDDYAAWRAAQSPTP